jgi:hypothetical protein
MMSVHEAGVDAHVHESLRGSRSTIQLQALMARALETWIIGKHHMEALLADKPAWPVAR